MKHSDSMWLLTLSDDALQQAILDQPILMHELQTQVLHPERIPQMIRIALAITTKNLKYIVTPGHGLLLIECLLKAHPAPEAAQLMMAFIRKGAMDQDALDFMLEHGACPKVFNVPDALLTPCNIAAIVSKENSQYGLIPDLVLTPAVEVEVFKHVPDVYGYLSKDVATDDLLRACTTGEHLVRLNEAHFQAYYLLWIRNPAMTISKRWIAPRTASMALEMLEMVYELAQHNFSQLDEKRGLLRLYSKALKEYPPEIGWGLATSSARKQIMKEVYGHELLKASILPVEVKREFLCEDLGL
jgi:hypothetical protein